MSVPTTSQPTIGLVMVVCNERHIIERCLKSIIPLIDRYFISYNGTDDTHEVIRAYMDKHGISGELEYHEWLDYGYNKSELLKLAHEEKLRDCTYLLWLDADEVYFDSLTNEYCTSKTREALLSTLESQHGVVNYHVRTLYGGSNYPRWNILRNNTLYEWDIPVHEYLQPVDQSLPCACPHIHTVKLVARAEGDRSLIREGGKYSKPAEYLRYFERWYARNPEKNGRNPRGQFYWAQTLEERYRETQDVTYMAQALDMYTRRIGNYCGSNEERYMAMLRVGRYYKSTNNTAMATVWWKRAVVEFPHRWEAVCELALLRDNVQDVCAFFIARKTLETFESVYAQLDTHMQYQLFCDQAMCRYSTPFECALLCHLCNRNDLAIRWNKYVLNLPERYAYIQNRAKLNNDAYVLASVKVFDMNPLRPADVIIIDDFYKDPMAVREFALAQSFEVRGNYPGVRTVTFKTNELKSVFEFITGGVITYWPDDYNGSYQWTDASMQSWIHRDATDYAALIYLTPNAPVNAGTTFYRHKATGLEHAPDDKHEQILCQDSRNMDAWEKTDVVGNMFNRLVLFNGRRSHISSDYFGSGKETGRLFQTFFFNVQKNTMNSTQ